MKELALDKLHHDSWTGTKLRHYLVHRPRPEEKGVHVEYSSNRI